DLVRAGRTNAVAFQCWTQSGRQLQALLDVRYADARIVTVATGPDWTARTGGPLLPWAGDFKTPYYIAPNEAFDARNEPVGWRDAGYRGTDFGPAVVGDPIAGLAPGGAATVARVEHQPAPLTRIADGQWLLDTGRELTAGLRLTLDVPAEMAGTTVEL